VLVADHFLFFLEVSDNLGEGLLQNLNLVLVRLDLRRLHLRPLLVLLLSPRVYRDVSFDFLVSFFLRLDLLFMFLQFVALRDRL